MKKLLFFLALAFCATIVSAQDSAFEKDILKLMEVNGSAANYDLAFDQIVAQFKTMKPNVPQDFWEAARRDVFNIKIKELNKKLVPVYQRAFTNEEVKQLIQFYTSPLGEKLTEGTTQVGKETMQIAQAWGMELGNELNSYLTEKGF
jgi:hypothetical protein